MSEVLLRMDVSLSGITSVVMEKGENGKYVVYKRFWVPGLVDKTMDYKEFQSFSRALRSFSMRVSKLLDSRHPDMAVHIFVHSRLLHLKRVNDVIHRLTRRAEEYAGSVSVDVL